MSEQNPETQNSKNLDLSFFGDILRDLENFRVEGSPASEDCSGNDDLELDSSESEPSDKTATISDDSFENEFSEHAAWMKKALETATTAKEITIIKYPNIPIKIRRHEKLLPKLDVKEETISDPFIESLQAQRKKHEEEMKQKAEASKGS